MATLATCNAELVNLNSLIVAAFEEPIANIPEDAANELPDCAFLDVWQIIDYVKAKDATISALSIKMAVDCLENDNTLIWESSFEGDKIYVLR